MLSPLLDTQLSGVFGWKADAMMHALKHAAVDRPSRLVDHPCAVPFDERTPALEALRIEKEATWRDILASRSGVCLSAGPTGSGKSTTVAVSAKYLSTIGRKVFPADRIPADHKDGVVVYGEIRDIKTVMDVFDLASLGLLVLATVHADTPAATLSSLLDIGLPEPMLGRLRGVISQRLVRTCCQACRMSDVGMVCADGSTHGRQLVSSVQAFEGLGSALHYRSVAAGLPDQYEADLRAKLERCVVWKDEIERVFGPRMLEKLA